MREYRAILIGCGNVGRALLTLCDERAEALAAQDLRLRVLAVVDRSGAAVAEGGLDLRQVLQTKQEHGGVAAYPDYGQQGCTAEEVVATLEADLLLETSPTSVWTGEPGLTTIRTALSRGMHVVTANKGPLVVAYHELMALAVEHGRQLRGAATVAAPLPAMEMARYALHGARVEAIEAIPNGTSNYVLALMEQGATREEGIRAAQQIGIAETDPSLDIDGWDSAAKIVILANTMLGTLARITDVSVQGIGQITQEDIVAVRSQGRALKLLASAQRRNDDGWALSVAPTPLPHDHPLAQLRGTGMGILLHTDLAGRVMLSVTGDDSPFGTAQAMIRDIVNIGREER